MPHLKLFVKAGSTGTNYGVCPLSQKLFMIIALKAKSGKYSYSVHAIDLAKPNEEFQQSGMKAVPAIIFDDQQFDSPPKIMEFLDNNFSEVDLSYDDILAEKACRELYAKFCFYMKSVSKDTYGLNNELERLDKHFTTRGASKGPFICGNQMTYLDCDLLPKLQQIRVAGKVIKDFDISTNHVGIWSYLKTAYSVEIFRQSSPSDEEIILHWLEKAELKSTISKPPKTREDLLNAKEPSYSFEVTEISEVSVPPGACAQSNTWDGPSSFAMRIEKDESSTSVITSNPANLGNSMSRLQTEEVAEMACKAVDSSPPKSDVISIIDKPAECVAPLLEELPKENKCGPKETVLNSPSDFVSKNEYEKSLDDLLEELQTMII